jgi:UDP-N-acetylmuramoyl-tripeptide--D-alanyl-D-alanine ligase
MSAWTDAAVSAALGQGSNAAGETIVYTTIGTDTRTLDHGSLFVALRGEVHDAHAFLAQAASAGARGAVVDHIPEGAPANLRYIVVRDTTEGLGRLARFHRRRIGARVVAITGSNGKTGTKELVRAALSSKYRVHATQGNLNNLIGVPVTLLAAHAGTELIVAELGTNVPGEIAQLSAIVEPDAAIITTISAEHLEGLGDLDGVLREETAVVPWLPRSSPVVVSDEPAMLAERARELSNTVHVAGFSDRADPIFRGFALSLDEEGRVRFRWAARDVALRLRGRHNGRNALLALALGRLWDVDDRAAAEAIARLESTRMRAEFHRIGDLVVIADCYNANPGSVAAAVDLLMDVPRRGGRVAVVGTMRELGEHSARLHAETARRIADTDIDLIVATGEFTEAFAEVEGLDARRIVLEADPDAAFEQMAERLSGTEVVLLKASRGVQLERLLPRISERWAVPHPHGEAFGSRASKSVTGERGDTPPAGHHSSTDPDPGHGGPRAFTNMVVRG